MGRWMGHGGALEGAMVLALALAACTNNNDSTVPTADTSEDLSVEDVFVQTLVDPIDILWVLDPTWPDGINALTDALEIGYTTLLLSDPAWRIGVMSSDAGTQQNRGAIRGVHETWPAQPDAYNVSGGGPSKVRLGIKTAFDDRWARNQEFLRPEGDLYVIVATNKPDQTTDNDLTNEAFLTWLRDLEHTQSVRIGAITVSAPNVYDHWEALANETGGAVFDVGSFDRGVETLILDAIGQKREFVLTQVPAAPPEEVTVVYRERPTIYTLNEGFEYIASTNSIRFLGEVPRVEAQIRIAYERSPGVAAPAGDPSSEEPQER